MIKDACLHKCEVSLVKVSLFVIKHGMNLSVYDVKGPEVTSSTMDSTSSSIVSNLSIDIIYDEVRQIFSHWGCWGP